MTKASDVDPESVLGLANVKFPGVFGGVIVTDDFLTTLNIVGNTSLQGTITAIYDIGCFFGAIIAFVIGDWLGRKKTILIGTTIMSVGAVLQITSYSVAQVSR